MDNSKLILLDDLNLKDSETSLRATANVWTYPIKCGTVATASNILNECFTFS
nr:MAG TPA: hypothetical protein [Bacteriophage sp.]